MINCFTYNHSQQLKIAFTVLVALGFTACGPQSVSEEPIVEQAIDSCKIAIEFPAAQKTEDLVNADYSGFLNSYWNEDTNKVSIAHRFQDGKLVQSRFFSEKGKIREEHNFKCRSFHGAVNLFYENGVLGKVVPFRYGHKKGVGYIYDSLGVMRQKVTFLNDSTTQDQVLYDENGVEVKSN